jgi:sigma-B regulation protein RsbU (phosphoserine phosphatase)
VGIPPELTGGGPVPEEVIYLEGGSLYIFTDGATEGYVEPGVELGADGFKAMVRSGVSAGQSAQTRIDAIADCLTKDGVVLRDDVTVLVIDDATPLQERLKRGDNTALKAVKKDQAMGEQGVDSVFEGSLCALTVPARAESLKLVRRAVSETSTACGFSHEQCQDLVLAVDEACQNVVRHAYGCADRGDQGERGDQSEGDIAVDLRREKGSFVILIRDYAPTVDVKKIKPRDLDDVRPGGLGVHFIREVMDTVEHLPPPDGQGNLLRLIKAI